ncbi:MAG: helix-turn-helix domain-containing protein [Clostridiales bacterium]|nr:helix-turn-helix domain-containing protein [Clostridiales bacterium]
MEDILYPREVITLEPNLDIVFKEITADMVRPFVPFHWHDSYELIYVLSGEAVLQKISDSDVVCPAGNIICTDAYEIHAMKAAPGTSFYLVMLPVSFMQKYIPNLDEIHFKIPINSDEPRVQTKVEYLRNTFHAMDLAESSKPDSYLLRFQSLLFEMLYELCHDFSIPAADTSRLRNNRDYQRLQFLVSYVHKNYREQISIDEISRQVHLQPQYFCHYFRKKFGQSFLNYVYEIRLVNIETDLLQTNLPIGQIAEKHGFVNQDLFRQKFYEKNHCTPRELRKANKKKS